MPKVQLSAKEFELVNDAGWFLTKQSIIDKVYTIFGAISEEERKIAMISGLEGKIFLQQPKISRGENYRGLPYVILDYPRIFGREEVIAIRIMFWWANYFSITLHLKGEYQDKFAHHLQSNVQTSILNDFYICTAKDEWAHHIDENNFRLISSISIEELNAQVHNKPFMKIAKKVPLTEWDNASCELLKIYSEMISLLVH